MRQAINVTPGQNLIAAQLPGSVPINSIIVDNPTGSWLLISTDNTFVPPYTIGFAHNLDYSAVLTSVSFVPGPAGQVSTTNFAANERVVVTLDSEHVVSSGGSDYTAFVTRQEQPEAISQGQQQDMGPGGGGNFTTLFLGGSLVKRLRAYAIWASDSHIGISRLTQYRSIVIIANTGLPFPLVVAKMVLGPNAPVVGGYIPQGSQDLPIAAEFKVIWDGPADAPAANSIVLTFSYGIL